MPFSVGPMELILVLAIALIVLGPKRLPEAGRALGKGMREFKDSVSGIGSHDDDDDDEEGEPSTLNAKTDGTAAPH
jgi:sec-independent protein translocase protein TatA